MNRQVYDMLKEIRNFSMFFDDSKTDISLFMKSYKLLLKSFKNLDIEYKPSFRKVTINNSDCHLFFPDNPKNIENPQKNILIFIHELSRTGAPVVALDLAKILVKNGFFVTLVSPSTAELAYEFLEEGIPVVIIKKIKYIWLFKNDVSCFYRNLELDNFVNSFDITFMVTATLYPYIKRYLNTDNKIIWWIHEGVESYKILGNYIPKKITNNIKVYCGGKYALNHLKTNDVSYYPEVLNYGVADEAYKYKKNKHSTINFMLAGSTGIRKGQKILLEAIKQLDTELINEAKFIFVGDPYPNDLTGIKIYSELEEYAKKNKNVMVKHSVKRDELYKMYCDIDVLVVASIDDPMPVVATENLMLSNILLCSTGTGTSYYLEDKVNGFVFNNGNPLELANKIEYIIKNKDKLDKIKENGRKIYEKYFEMSIFEENVLKIIGGIK